MSYHTPAGWHEKVGCEIEGPKGRDPDVCDYCNGEFTDGDCVIYGNHVICNACHAEAIHGHSKLGPSKDSES